jgi:hypothetical protein
LSLNDADCINCSMEDLQNIPISVLSVQLPVRRLMCSYIKEPLEPKVWAMVRLTHIGNPGRKILILLTWLESASCDTGSVSFLTYRSFAIAAKSCSTGCSCCNLQEFGPFVNHIKEAIYVAMRNCCCKITKTCQCFYKRQHDIEQDLVRILTRM